MHKLILSDRYQILCSKVPRNVPDPSCDAMQVIDTKV